jgi:hypothetical protein
VDIADPLCKQMIVRQSGDELLILDLMANRVHQLNRTASIVWNLRAEGWEAEAIAAEFTQRFEVDEQRAHRDVVDTLELMGSRGLFRQGGGVGLG